MCTTTARRSVSTHRARWGKISSLQGENTSHRERAEPAETKLKTFEGIKDLAAVIKALETVANLDAGQLVKAGEVETIQAAAVKASDKKNAALNKTHAEELTQRDTKFNKLQTNFHKAVISNAFASSQFVKDKLAVTPGVAQKTFEENIRIDDNGHVYGLRAIRVSAALGRARLGTFTRRSR